MALQGRPPCEAPAADLDAEGRGYLHLGHAAVSDDDIVKDTDMSNGAGCCFDSQVGSGVPSEGSVQNSGLDRSRSSVSPGSRQEDPSFIIHPGPRARDDGGDGDHGGVLWALLALAQDEAASIPPRSLTSLIRIVGRYAQGSALDRLLIATAAQGKPLRLLMGLYRSVPHGHDLRPECCSSCHLVLDSMLQLCGGNGLAASVFRAEMFVTRRKSGSSAVAAAAAAPGSPSIPAAPRSTAVRMMSSLSPTALLGDLVQGARSALRHCKACPVPDLAWDGSVRAYGQGKAPSDPCSGEATVVVGGDNGTLRGKGPSLLEKWVGLLEMAADSSSGKAAVRELYRRHIMDLLEDVLAVASGVAGSPNTLLEAVERVYGGCARHSQVRHSLGLCLESHTTSLMIRPPPSHGVGLLGFLGF